MKEVNLEESPNIDKMAENKPINTRVQMYTTMEPLEAKNVTYKGLICVNKASRRSILILLNSLLFMPIVSLL